MLLHVGDRSLFFTALVKNETVSIVRYPLCKVVQFVVQVRCDAVVFSYQGNSGTDLLAGQPEAVGQRCRQRPVLILLSYFKQTGDMTVT